MSDKRDYTVLSPVSTPDGITKNGTVSLTDEMAKRFLEMPEPPIADPDASEDAGEIEAQGRSDAPLTLDALVEAIGTLNPGDKALWTKGNVPKTEALAEVLKADVSANERDEAWKVYQQQIAE